MKKIALIPSRSGSKRIKNKNIRNFCGHPLMAYTIEAAIKSKVFDDIIIATDSKKYAEIAKYYGAEVPFLRKAEISGDQSPDLDWVEFMMNGLERMGKKYDIFSILRPTSPFRMDTTIKKAFDLFLANKDFDSLRAIEKCNQHPGKMWIKNKKNLNPLLPFYNKNIPWHSSQYDSLPEIFIQNASLEISWTKSLIENKSISGNKILGYETEGYEGFDINNIEDFYLAEILMTKGIAKTIDIKKMNYKINK